MRTCMNLIASIKLKIKRLHVLDLVINISYSHKRNNKAPK